MSNIILKLSNIAKEFPGVRALDNVNFELFHGEVHALLGENGAGKSTMIKILTGAHSKTSGKFIFEGKEIEHISPDISKKIGINAIYQELTVFDELTVAQNIFMGKEINGKVLTNDKKMNEEAKKIFDNMGIDINPNSLVKELSIAQKQMVEIARVLSSETKVLIMDEPNVIRKKISRAVTDSIGVVNYTDEQPGVKNLINILCAIKGYTPEEVVKMYDGKGYAEFKNDVAEAIVEELAPVQEKVKALLGDKKALEENNIPYSEENVFIGDYDYSGAYRVTKEIINNRKDITAIFSISDIMAVGAAKSVIDQGLQVGEDISIMGFDGMDISKYYNPGITTVKQPKKNMANNSIDLLLALLAKKEDHKHIIFETKIIERESCKEVV